MQQLAVLAEPIQAGVTIGNHWVAEAPLPPRPGVQHWEGASVTDGTPVEILRLTPEADPLQQRDFLQAHRALAELPAALKPLYTGADSTIIRPFARSSLAELERRLTSEEAVALAGWYGPALLALEGHSGGLFTAEEFVLDEEDVFRLAPLGAPGQELPTLPEELIPPELRLGGEPTGASSLYSLGVVLYKALTGIDPISALDTNGNSLPPPPPSQQVAGLDHRADRILMALLDADPQRRARALPPTPLRPPTWRQTHVAAEAAGTAESPATDSTAQHSRKALFDAPHVVVVVPRKLHPVILKKIAGWLDVPAETINEIALAGLPVPLYGAPDQNRARKKVAEYVSTLRMPARSVAMSPTLPIYTVIWAALLLAVAGAARVSGLPDLIVILGGLMGLLAIPATIAHDIWFAGRVREALDRIQHSAQNIAGQVSEVTADLQERARTLHIELKGVEQLDHAKSDLLSVLEMTVESLEDLSVAEKRGAREVAKESLQVTLKKALDAIETQLRHAVSQSDGTHDVELETLLTRAISVKHEAKKLRGGKV